MMDRPLRVASIRAPISQQRIRLELHHTARRPRFVWFYSDLDIGRLDSTDIAGESVLEACELAARAWEGVVWDLQWGKGKGKKVRR